MRLALALVLLAGCAEGMSIAPAPDVGKGGDGSARDSGAPEVVRVCDAALETLNGRAKYVAGTARAAEPDAPAAFNEPKTCGEWFYGSALMQSIETNPADVTVENGVIGTFPTFMASAAAGPTGCTYVLRFTSPASGFNQPCAITKDYALIVP